MLITPANSIVQYVSVLLLPLIFTSLTLDAGYDGLWVHAPRMKRKRQREALRRRMSQPGYQTYTPAILDNLLILTISSGSSRIRFIFNPSSKNMMFIINDCSMNCSLLYEAFARGWFRSGRAASTPQAKWEFMRAFLLDPQNMSDIVIESEYIDQSQHDDTHQWVETSTWKHWRKQFPRPPAEVAFLEKPSCGEAKRAGTTPRIQQMQTCGCTGCLRKNTDTEKAPHRYFHQT